MTDSAVGDAVRVIGAVLLLFAMCQVHGCEVRQCNEACAPMRGRLTRYDCYCVAADGRVYAPKETRP